MNIDFKTFNTIITEIKKCRKGTAMTVILVCLACAAVDYILRKHGITENWYTQSYLIVGFVATCVWSVRVFNKIADTVDKKKYLQNKYKLVKPILFQLKADEEYLLKKFVQDNLCKTVFSDEYLNKINHNLEVINTIFKRFKPFGYTIKQCAHVPEFIFEIDREFFELLKIHFKS